MSSLTQPTRTRLANPLASTPDLTGRRAVVTGGSSGLGLVTTRALLRRGAEVVIGARDTSRAEDARDRLVAELNLPAGRVTVARLDLIDPHSVREFAKTVGDAALDLLVLNAGISSVPLRHDHAGIESQFATNHLGHFALTGHLLPALDGGTASRIVTVSSSLYTGGKLDLDDLSDSATYSPGRAYSRSKLANVIFAVELQRRLAAQGSTTRSFAAHPGMARTPLHATYPSATTRVLTSAVARVIGRDPEPADIGVLTAALNPEATPALFWGPVGSKTAPDALGLPFAAAASNSAPAAALWSKSEQLSDIRILS
ncbi:SDR family NAD(P)-dependent oxidoreductase [Frondihabitans sp. VKM Ac-2883]|uniref:SDR family NAD(P)-dependent oxidoreductase n=1 Tax=Frondihabitans sp. VKM Ac-2883 TaxID=2783823 RepID=UPI00188ACCE3|nr:SDR family NAD(P)-dependent oxidoreductase [Frondihabitans sp. VKM Ac-2883]MBF4575478.1 SDR family NAD(P)-dependent oxidoreductase [Frondihabitans sp. VKM Ac-2883]